MSNENDLLAKFFGYALRTVGVLIMVISGLCSGFGMMFVVSQPSMLPVVLIVGGIPFGFGWVCWWAGGLVMPKKRFAPRHSIHDDPPAAGDPPPAPPSDPPAKPPTVS